MRASEIKVGEEYAVTGQGISLAKVHVLTKMSRPTQAPRFLCVVLEGKVYQGWLLTKGALDMAYVGIGEECTLIARDFLRPWAAEMERRTAKRNVREQIHDVLAEMDHLLIALGLHDAQIQHLETPEGYTAVAVLSLDDVRRLHESRADDRAEMAGVPGEGDGSQERSGVSGPTAD